MFFAPLLTVGIASAGVGSLRLATILAISLLPILYSVTVVVWLFSSDKAIFDRTRGSFSVKRPNRKPGAEVPLEKIRALQMISYWHAAVDDKRKPGVVYQLNLVLDNGSRAEVFSQRQPIFKGNRRALINDAKKLSRWLHVPLWDEVNDFGI